MIHGERVTLAFAKAAAARGALVATYLRADAAIVAGGRVVGIRTMDVAPQPGPPVERTFDIAARFVVNATGPQGNLVAGRLLGTSLPTLVPALSLGLNVVTRSLGLDAAVGGMARGRLFFAAPWRGVTIAGTSHEPYTGSADIPEVPPADVDTFLRDFNAAFPRAGLTRADIRLVHRGLLPTAAVVGGEVRLLKASVIRDHADDGHPGLVSVVGTRYTTARHTAQLTVDRVFTALGQPAPPCATETTPLAGGDVGSIDAFFAAARQSANGLAAEAGERLARLYGTEHTAVRQLLADGPLERAALDHLSDARRRSGLRDARGDGGDAGRRRAAAHRSRRDRASGASGPRARRRADGLRAGLAAGAHRGRDCGLRARLRRAVAGTPGGRRASV